MGHFIIALALARALDAGTTCAAYAVPGWTVKDANPLVTSCKTIVVAEVGATAASWWVDRRLRAKGHRNIANVLVVVTTGIEAGLVAHNLHTLGNMR